MTEWKKGMPEYIEALHDYDNAPLYLINYDDSFFDDNGVVEAVTLGTLHQRRHGLFFREHGNSHVEILADRVLHHAEIKRPQGDL